MVPNPCGEPTTRAPSSPPLSTLAPESRHQQYVLHGNYCLDMTACYVQPSNRLVESEPGSDLLCFINTAQTLLVEGWPFNYVVGSAEIDLDIVFSRSSAPIQPATVFQWTTNLLQPFDVLGVPERLGLMLSASLYIAVWHCS